VGEAWSGGSVSTASPGIIEGQKVGGNLQRFSRGKQAVGKPPDRRGKRSTSNQGHPANASKVSVRSLVLESKMRAKIISGFHPQDVTIDEIKSKLRKNDLSVQGRRLAACKNAMN
jgi:hypothetical protein